MIFPHKELPAEDTHHLRRAEGWLELGSMAEASEELDKITSQFQPHPDVLSLRYQVHAKAENWPLCEQIARTLTTLVPEHPSGWISLSQCLHFQKRTQEAHDSLFEVAERFPNAIGIPYDLACYATQLGRLDPAKTWLEVAFKLTEDSAKLKQAALKDKDLEPLWDYIQQI